jgi:hypothetical protein
VRALLHATATEIYSCTETATPILISSWCALSRMQRQLKLIAPLLLSSLFVCAETFSAAFSGSEPSKATSRASVTPKMSGAFQPGSAPPQHFFRDVIYQQSAASGNVVPWDVGQAQPALATAREIFKGCVLDVGTGICCPLPLSVFTLGHQQQ